jgi:hypothetical protein
MAFARAPVNKTYWQGSLFSMAFFHRAEQGNWKKISDAAESIEAEEVIWLPPRDSNPDMLIQSQLSCR